ncbi:MAG: dihydroorotate dehydrogenase [Planctomycetes bacterium]|nr:dihydroorotate dehydrogenase [Planctomycetota bacterium]
MANMAVTVAGLELANPVMSASGTYGHGLEMRHFAAPASLGAWVSKTVTRKPRPGNPLPRIAETEAGFLNSIGLENRGIDSYLRDVLPDMAREHAVVITNIGGESVDDFAELAARLDGERACHALEVNLSCPNVQGGKLPFSTSPAMAESVIARVRAATKKPVFAKLSPNVSDIGEIARAVEAGGADGITAVNTLLGMRVDWKTRRPALNTIQGGYSGIGIKPIALRCAWSCARAVSIPVIGCGGIACAEDAFEFLVVGCRAVQFGTASFTDPGKIGRLAAEMSQLLDQHGIASVTDLIGTLRAPNVLAKTPGAPS